LDPIHPGAFPEKGGRAALLSAQGDQPVRIYGRGRRSPGDSRGHSRHSTRGYGLSPGIATSPPEQPPRMAGQAAGGLFRRQIRHRQDHLSDKADSGVEGAGAASGCIETSCSPHTLRCADVVVGASSVQVAVFHQKDGSADLDGIIARHFGELDLILAEGFKQGNYPKIEIHRSAHKAELLCEPGDLLAMVSDEPLACNLPQFDLEDAAAVADFLLAWLCGPATMSG
jgi:hypothetical protein